MSLPVATGLWHLVYQRYNAFLAQRNIPASENVATQICARCRASGQPCPSSLQESSFRKKSFYINGLIEVPNHPIGFLYRRGTCSPASRRAAASWCNAQSVARRRRGKSRRGRCGQADRVRAEGGESTSGSVGAPRHICRAAMPHRANVRTARHGASARAARQAPTVEGERCWKRRWRPRPESNRGARICNPLRHHSATRPQAPETVHGAVSTGSASVD